MTFEQKVQWLKDRGLAYPLYDNPVSWIITMIWNIVSFAFTVLCIVFLVYTWLGGFASKPQASVAEVPEIDQEVSTPYGWDCID